MTLEPLGSDDVGAIAVSQWGVLRASQFPQRKPTYPSARESPARDDVGAIGVSRRPMAPMPSQWLQRAESSDSVGDAAGVPVSPAEADIPLGPRGPFEHPRVLPLGPGLGIMVQGCIVYCLLFIVYCLSFIVYFTNFVDTKNGPLGCRGDRVERVRHPEVQGRVECPLGQDLVQRSF